MVLRPIPKKRKTSKYSLSKVGFKNVTLQNFLASNSMNTFAELHVGKIFCQIMSDDGTFDLPNDDDVNASTCWSLPVSPCCTLYLLAHHFGAIQCSAPGAFAYEWSSTTSRFTWIKLHDNEKQTTKLLQNQLDQRKNCVLNWVLTSSVSY